MKEQPFQLVSKRLTLEILLTRDNFAAISDLTIANNFLIMK